jgi:hypothetical protein
MHGHTYNNKKNSPFNTVLPSIFSAYWINILIGKKITFSKVSIISMRVCDSALLNDLMRI